MPPPREPLLGPLGRRLLAAFVAVAVAAVALVAALSMRSVQTQTQGLEAGDRARAERSIVQALAEAYARAGSWEGADLATVRALAQAAGLQVLVLNATGGPVASLSVTPTGGSGPGATTPAVPPPTGTSGPTAPPGGGDTSDPATGSPSGSAPAPTTGPGQPGGAHSSVPAAPTGGPGAGGRALPGQGSVVVVGVMALAAPSTGSASRGTPIMVNGVQVGSAVIEAVPQQQLPAARAEAAILRTVGLASLAAVLLALAVSVAVSRRITRPLVALAAATRALERGDPLASQLLRPGPGELGQLSSAFAGMATALQREDALRRAMTADVAHELRTPVTILRGSTEQLLDGLAPLTREAVGSLHEEVLRLERLVEDLATLSAAEAAGLRLERRRVDLAALARQSVGRLATRLADARLQAAVTTGAGESAPGEGAPEERSLVVDGDPARLGQVVTNLLVNAIDFTPRRGRIGVDVQRRGAMVALVVSDTGPGVPQQELPHLFERFYRGSAAGHHRGTGIGLAVVAELVAAHGGSVEAASPAAGGAVFTVLLPAC